MNKIKEIAVENFLGSMDKNLSKADHLMNLHQDAKLYKWNAATVEVIRKAINLVDAQNKVVKI